MVASEGILSAPLALDAGERCDHDSLGRVQSLAGTLRLLVYDLERELKQASDKLRAEIERRLAVEAALRQAREEAEQASRAKSEFLGLMSHELRTPLNAIIGFSEIMRLELFGGIDNPVYRGYVNDIYGAGQHLLGLLKNILDLAHLNAQTIEMRNAAIAVSSLLESCRTMFEGAASETGVDLVVEVARGAPDLLGDEVRVRQVLANLISNAIKFTPAQGRITVSASAGPDGYRFMVSDTGIGITAEDHRVVLTPFGRSRDCKRRGVDGAGLGLTLAKCLVERHGGRLELASEPSSGTTVTVVFPPERIAGSASAP